MMEPSQASQCGRTRARSGRRALPPCPVPASVSTLPRSHAERPCAAEAPFVIRPSHRLAYAFVVGRLARWYGAGTGDFIIGVLGIVILAVTMAAWMLVDHCDPARAAVAAAGALMLALPRTARRVA